MSSGARTLRLRRWQKDALDLLATSTADSFLVVATPGAGKTTFALAALIHQLAENPDRKVVIVAPTRHLKIQWAKAATRLGLHLEPDWSSSDGLPRDMHGIVVTYQQVASNPEPLRYVSHRCLVVLDEIHHAGTERAWGDALLEAFTGAPRRLCLSGTPFRSDTHAIPFVRYDGDLAHADYEYGYADALSDRHVVRPVFFPTMGGFMEWTAPDGTVNAATFDDALDKSRAGQRLRTALSLEGDWLPSVLAEAHNKLMDARVGQPDAAGLVIAADQDHAKGIADLLRRRHGVRASVAVSDDPGASRHIAEFAEGDAPWLVAVRMVSEGVDIPRLRLGVFATTTTTELFFRQAVGRFVRHTGGGGRHEQAWLYIPDDPRLRTWAATISEQRRHSLRKNWEEGERESVEKDPAAFDEVLDDDVEQMSLFEVLSASATASPAPTIGYGADVPADDSDADTSVTVELPAPPPTAAPMVPELIGLTRSEQKKALRARNAELARKLAYEAGVTPQVVNWHLNQAVRLARIADASVEQLLARAAQAEQWLDAG